MDQYPAAGFAGQLFAEMGQIVSQLESLGAVQVSSAGASVQGTASKDAAKQGLEAMLDSINRAAQALAVDSPGFDDKFRRPRQKGDSAVLVAAKAFLSEVTPFKPDFIKFGLGADFQEQLQNRIAAFEQAVNERANKSQMRVSATAGLKETIAAGLKLRLQLDAIVRNSTERDSPVLAAWESASHIELPSRRKESKTSTPEVSKAAEPVAHPEAAE